MQQPEAEKQQQALRDLDALGRERDLAHGSWHRPFARAAGHFSAAEADASDPVELWGRRIGRTLAAIAFIAFCIYLYLAHVR